MLAFACLLLCLPCKCDFELSYGYPLCLSSPASLCLDVCSSVLLLPDIDHHPSGSGVGSRSKKKRNEKKKASGALDVIESGQMETVSAQHEEQQAAVNIQKGFRRWQHLFSKVKADPNTVSASSLPFLPSLSSFHPYIHPSSPLFLSSFFHSPTPALHLPLTF